MNALHITHKHTLAAVAIAATLLTACASAPMPPQGSAEARDKLTQLQSDPLLATRAPVELKEAEQAVVAAEQTQKNAAVGAHLVYLADQKIDIAAARAQTLLLEDQRKMLSEQREKARLDARTSEADSARLDAKKARSEADAALMIADSALIEADQARLATQEAQAQSGELQRQIDDLNAKATERGLVVTLGDLTFGTGKSEIKSSASGHLNKLAVFLNQYPDRNVVIEGHTDNVGSDSSNLQLSQKRADAVKNYLLGQNIAPERLESSGKGEAIPIADNDTDAGRQQNRRVEVIIINATKSAN